MKKWVCLLLAVTVVLSIATVAFARTLEEEKQAVRDYLTLIDAKINKYRAAGNTAKVKQLQGEKAATLRRWYKLKAQLEAEQAMPEAPKVTPKVVAAKAPEGLFGWGLKTDLTGIYLMTGKGKYNGAVGLRANVILDDPLALGTIVGMSADSVKYRIGLGGLYGVDINGARIKAIPIFVDGVLSLPADWMMGLDTYVGGGLNYTVYGSGQTAGSYGAEAYVGLKADLGLGLGQTGFELGYTAIRANGSTPKLSAKGLSFAVSQPIVL